MEKYKQLSMEERSLIQTQLTMGFNPSWVAGSLGRSVSTITRELHRNGWERPVVKRGRGRPPIAGKYRAVLAQARGTRNSAKPRVERRFRQAMRFGLR
jgi:transposase, IS30 family